MVNVNHKKKTKLISMRVEEDEYLRINEMANNGGVNVSDMLRTSITGRTLNGNANAKVVCELRKQGLLLKNALTDPRLSNDVNGLLKRLIPQIIGTINKISVD